MARHKLSLAAAVEHHTEFVEVYQGQVRRRPTMPMFYDGREVMRVVLRGVNAPPYIVTSKNRVIETDGLHDTVTLTH